MAQAKYFAKFSCVEIDSSFYNLPKLETAQRWRESAPEGFQFALKAWQVITHCSDSPTYKHTRLDPRDRPHCGHFGFNPTIRWAWDETFAVAKALEAFLVLFQCPASFRPTRKNVDSLRKFFERAKRGRFLMGWEPRGPWDAELVGKLCDELDLVHVVDPFQTMPAGSARFRYFRLHGIGGHGHRFSVEELHRLRQMCVAHRTTVYCLFNNAIMTTDAERFAQLTATA
jgi:uncharacterized protein YecE (DUF72 family)